jgi:hypothetical protein
MYVTIFYICLNDVKKLLEDDKDRLEHVGVTTNCMYKHNFNIRLFVGFIV